MRAEVVENLNQIIEINNEVVDKFRNNNITSTEIKQALKKICNIQDLDYMNYTEYNNTIIGIQVRFEGYAESADYNIAKQSIDKLNKRYSKTAYNKVIKDIDRALDTLKGFYKSCKNPHYYDSWYKSEELRTEREKIIAKYN